MKALRFLPLSLILSACLLSSCSGTAGTASSVAGNGDDTMASAPESMETPESAEAPETDLPAASYHQITQEEAALLMENEDAVILDVRRPDEFAAGHIPGAICIPNESIGESVPELPDFSQMILVYCRSGRRSKEASQKLADLGYTQVYEFGGILDWTGPVVTD